MKSEDETISQKLFVLYILLAAFFLGNTVIAEFIGVKTSYNSDSYSLYSNDGNYLTEINHCGKIDPGADWFDYFRTDGSNPALLLKVLVNDEIIHYGLSSDAEIFTYCTNYNELHIINARLERFYTIQTAEDIKSLAVSDQGNTIAVAYSDMVIDLFTNQGKRLRTLYGLTFSPEALKYSAGGDSVIVLGNNSYAIFDLTRENVLHYRNLRPFTLMDIDRSAGMAIVSNHDGYLIWIMNLTSDADQDMAEKYYDGYWPDTIGNDVNGVFRNCLAFDNTIYSGLISSTGRFIALCDESNGVLYLHESDGNRMEAISANTYYDMHYDFSTDDHYFYLQTYEKYDDDYNYTGEYCNKVYDLNKRKWISEFPGFDFKSVPNSPSVVVNTENDI
jgi:hypothetical protein